MPVFCVIVNRLKGLKSFSAVQDQFLSVGYMATLHKKVIWKNERKMSMAAILFFRMSSKAIPSKVFTEGKILPNLLKVVFQFYAVNEEVIITAFYAS